MALGFDMASAIFRLPVGQQRVDDWRAFLTAWNKKPVFAGRYFGDGDFNWVFGEVPGELKTRFPGFFEELKYIWALTPTGTYTHSRRVDIRGNPIERNADGTWPDDSHPVVFEQQGETSDGTKLPSKTVRDLGRAAAWRSCQAIVRQVQPVLFDPPADLELPSSRALYVFLDIEPQTKLHKDYWQGWAETVTTFTMNLGTALKPEIVQPFRPALYCAMDSDGPWLPDITSVFKDNLLPACYAVATGWNPAGYVFAGWAPGWFPGAELREPYVAAGGPAGNVPVHAATATAADVQARWPRFGKLWQYYVGDVPIVVWQYFLNLWFNPPVHNVTLSRNGPTVTGTTTAPHRWGIGDRVTVRGADQGGYNGTFPIAEVPTPTTFTYVVTGSPSTPATGTIRAFVLFEIDLAATWEYGRPVTDHMLKIVWR
jgi:hypothetical protein